MESGKLAELRQNLATHFSKSELETLSFDLGLDYENLPANTKDALAREIVRSLNRKQRLNHLIDRCRQLRPQVTWPDMPAHVPTDSTPSFLNRASLARMWKGVESGKRQVLLGKVKKFWVDGVLERTLKERAGITLTWLRETRFVDHPWESLGGDVFEQATGSPEQDDVLAAYMDADQGLLILGDSWFRKDDTIASISEGAYRTSRRRSLRGGTSCPEFGLVGRQPQNIRRMDN